MTKPEISTDPKWAAEQARLQALDEAAAYIESLVGIPSRYTVAEAIRALKEKGNVATE